MTKLPPITAKLTEIFEAWVTGSAAEPDAKLDEVADIDLVVPYHRWAEAAQLVPAEACVNTFGGWKFVDRDTLVDVWPGDLSRVLGSPKTKWVWQPRLNVRFRREQ